MLLTSLRLLILFLLPFLTATATPPTPRCRSQPGDASFPTAQDLAGLNASIDGRLLTVVPSAEVCMHVPGGCSDAVWDSASIRAEIPGAMLQVNWEQDYASHPPSLCFRNSTVCGQGSVPLYAINATTAAHIQAGVRFAQRHDLRVAIKASGHDYLGRSTAKNALLLWTRHFDNVTFHDAFVVGGENVGSAVTVGSGVGLHVLYQAAKARGKIFVGGTAANVVPAGGYIQGAGHSALGPLLGMGADNTLEFQVVLADGTLVTANRVSHPDLFWALRGGGAGSWGVIVSATVRTFPTFDVVNHGVLISGNTSAIGPLATLHARHIFDWDALHVGQYFFAARNGSILEWAMSSYFPNTTIAAVNASLAPFLEEVAGQGYGVDVLSLKVGNVNDLLSPDDSDTGGMNEVLGSRLIPEDVYRENATAVGETYAKLFEGSELGILGHLVAGGQVAKNARIDSAVNPKWRTAKTHVVIVAEWADSTSVSDVEAVREGMTEQLVPVLAGLAGSGSASYSNEADVREPEFETTFFGGNYGRLSAIKEAYDSAGLFIVGAGVGSEKWDAEGMCRVK